MIRFESLQKKYPEFELLLDLEIADGSLVSILGPSGSGKTTTLRLVGGFERPDRGRLFVGGADVTEKAPAERHIGFVFQDYTLFPHMNVADNIAYGLRKHGADRARIERRVEELLSFVKLSGYGTRRVQTLSGGEMQRVAVARALAIDPSVLVLDEPFSAIDTPLRRGLRQEIVRLQRELGITTVFVTHSQEEALSISDKVIVMREGRVEQYATPIELYERPANRFVASFAGAANFIPGTISHRGAREIILDAFAEFSVSARDGTTAQGDTVTLMVRPNHLKRARPGAKNAFHARITACQYFAHYFEYSCEAGGVSFSFFSGRRYRVGEELRLSFEPEDAVLLYE